MTLGNGYGRNVDSNIDAGESYSVPLGVVFSRSPVLFMLRDPAYSGSYLA